MEFEKVCEQYLGYSDNGTYYANFFENDTKRKAILFSICLKETAVNSKKYESDSLEELNNCVSILLNPEAEYKDDVNCIKLLLALKNK